MVTLAMTCVYWSPDRDATFRSAQRKGVEDESVATAAKG
jgi:hypothetical protein